MINFLTINLFWKKIFTYFWSGTRGHKPFLPPLRPLLVLTWQQVEQNNLSSLSGWRAQSGCRLRVSAPRLAASSRGSTACRAAGPPARVWAAPQPPHKLIRHVVQRVWAWSKPSTYTCVIYMAPRYFFNYFILIYTRIPKLWW